MVWNPESTRLDSRIQRVEIQNPDAGIQNLEAGIRNPGPSWILLHRAIMKSAVYPKQRVLASCQTPSVVSKGLETVFFEYGLHEEPKQARRQDTSGLGNCSAYHKEVAMCGSGSSCNGAERIGKRHTSCCPHNEAQQPIDPETGDDSIPSGNEEKDCLYHRDRSQYRGVSEGEPRSDGVKHGRKSAPEELSYQGAENVGQKVIPRDIFRRASFVVVYHSCKNGS